MLQQFDSLLLWHSAHTIYSASTNFLFLDVYWVTWLILFFLAHTIFLTHTVYLAHTICSAHTVSSAHTICSAHIFFLAHTVCSTHTIFSFHVLASNSLTMHYVITILANSCNPLHNHNSTFSLGHLVTSHLLKTFWNFLINHQSTKWYYLNQITKCLAYNK